MSRALHIACAAAALLALVGSARAAMIVGYGGPNCQGDPVRSLPGVSVFALYSLLWGVFSALRGGPGSGWPALAVVDIPFFGTRCGRWGSVAMPRRGPPSLPSPALVVFAFEEHGTVTAWGEGVGAWLVGEPLRHPKLDCVDSA